MYLDEAGKDASPSSSSSSSCRLDRRGSRVSLPGEGEKEASPGLEGEGHSEGGWCLEELRVTLGSADGGLGEKKQLVCLEPIWLPANTPHRDWPPEGIRVAGPQEQFWALHTLIVGHAPSRCSHILQRGHIKGLT